MATPDHETVKSEPPLGPTDVPGWQAAVKDGSYKRCRLEHVVVAIQDLRADLDKPTFHALAEHLSGCIFGILRSKVSTSHPNRGEDIIDEVHDVAWKAILDPSSRDGQGFRRAFTPRLLHRLRDAFVRQRNERQNKAKFNLTVLASSDGESLDGMASFSSLDEAELIGQKLDVETALEQIEDPRKRLAFRLYMDGVPIKSKKVDSIAKALNVSERTIRTWIEEAQEILKQYKGDVS